MDIIKKIEQQQFLPPKDFVSTGSLALDYIMSGKCNGKGGFPIGHFCEISGPEASGKTYLCKRIVAKWQEKFGERN